VSRSISFINGIFSLTRPSHAGPRLSRWRNLCIKRTPFPSLVLEGAVGYDDALSTRDLPHPLDAIMEVRVPAHLFPKARHLKKSSRTPLRAGLHRTHKVFEALDERGERCDVRMSDVDFDVAVRGGSLCLMRRRVWRSGRCRARGRSSGRTPETMGVLIRQDMLRGGGLGRGRRPLGACRERLVGRVVRVDMLR